MWTITVLENNGDSFSYDIGTGSLTDACECVGRIFASDIDIFQLRLEGDDGFSQLFIRNP